MSVIDLGARVLRLHLGQIAAISPVGPRPAMRMLRTRPSVDKVSWPMSSGLVTAAMPGLSGAEKLRRRAPTAFGEAGAVGARGDTSSATGSDLKTGLASTGLGSLSPW